MQAGGHRFDPGTLHRRTAWNRAVFVCRVADSVGARGRIATRFRNNRLRIDNGHRERVAVIASALEEGEALGEHRPQRLDPLRVTASGARVVGLRGRHLRVSDKFGDEHDRRATLGVTTDEGMTPRVQVRFDPDLCECRLPGAEDVAGSPSR